MALAIVCPASSCGAVTPDKATATVTASRAYKNYTADKITDGDLKTGWVSATVVSETVAPFVRIDYDKKVKVSRITINDDFEEGRTKEIVNYETVIPNVKSSAFRYSSAPEENSTAINAFMENSDGCWRATKAPTEAEPQAFYAEFRTAIEADGIVVDNEEEDIVPTKFKVLVSENSVPDAEKLNPAYEGWTEAISETDNKDYVVKKEIATAKIKAVLYVVEKQDDETSKACLKGLYLQKKLAEPDAAHYPVDFDLLYSSDGESYEIIEIRKNDKPIFEYVFEKAVEIISIKYIPVTEYDGNKPSVGEIIVE